MLPGAVATAQDTAGDAVPPAANQPVTSVLLTVDQERLFTESAFGKRVAAELDRRSRALAAENRSIEAGLVAEEQALTDERPSLPADQFRKKADDFDAKVQAIRGEQDQKAKELGSFREGEQKRFASELGSILSEIARDRGALAVMDRRVMLISADQIDITDDAIALVDQRLGDGAAGAPPPK